MREQSAGGLIVLAPHGSRRVAMLQAALATAGRVPAIALDYAKLLDRPGRLRDALDTRPDAWVKLESPGEDAALQHALIAHGRRVLDVDDAPFEPLQHGELAERRAWFAGFSGLLQGIEHVCVGLPLRWVNAPADIVAMGDKLACRDHLQAAGVNVPALLGSGEVRDLDDLLARCRAQHQWQVFLKPRYGSSAAGVVACRLHRDGRMVIESATRAIDQDGRLRLVNYLRPQRLRDPAAIRLLIDAICAEGAYAERWVPKPRAGTQGHFDLRLVMLAGEPRQRLARISHGALTNLHLGNRRADADQLLDTVAMDTMETIGRQCAAAFPASHVIGLDVIVRGRSAQVLEANAFGDLLLDVRYQGAGTHDDQARRFGAMA
ncbi:MAG: STM4014 family protein [Pseudomonadota bacterium]|nr:STM4014 family protein [Pseudomonadota bacterium]